MSANVFCTSFQRAESKSVIGPVASARRPTARFRRHAARCRCERRRGGRAARIRCDNRQASGDLRTRLSETPLQWGVHETVKRMQRVRPSPSIQDQSWLYAGRNDILIQIRSTNRRILSQKGRQENAEEMRIDWVSRLLIRDCDMSGAACPFTRPAGKVRVAGQTPGLVRHLGNVGQRVPGLRENCR